MKSDVLIAADYWSPGKALKYGYPWLVPSAIVRICQLLRPEMKVLEFGAGGSTVFFAQRCASIVSYETAPKYINAVLAKIEEEDCDAHIKVEMWPADEKQIEIAAGITGIYDVILVDSAPNRYRRDILCKIWRLVPIGGFVISDNYHVCGVDYSTIPTGWALECYDDPHWAGWGTAITRRIT